MGSTWSARLAAPAALADAAAAAVAAALEEVTAAVSAWRPDSALSRFNAAAPSEAVEAPPILLEVLDAALEAAALTGGAYDPTGGALVDLWGFGPAPFRGGPPSAEDVARLQARRGAGASRLRGGDGRLVQPGGLALDLNALAKGFAVDRATAAAQAVGVEAGLVEAGGEVRAWGARPHGAPWWVELEGPPEAPARSRTLLALVDGAVATSGDHRRRFLHGDRAFGHTLDMRTGAPRPPGGPAVATVAHGEALWADALATCLLLLPPEEGLRLADTRGGAARLVWEDGRERLSPRMAAMLET